MAEDKDTRRAYISRSCIDGAQKKLEDDPDGEAVFVGDHAYFIRSGAHDDDEADNVPMGVNIAGTEFNVRWPFPSLTIRALREKIASGEATNITNLLKRKKRR